MESRGRVAGLRAEATTALTVALTADFEAGISKAKYLEKLGVSMPRLPQMRDGD